MSSEARPASESSSALAGVNPRNACHLCCAQRAPRPERRLRAQGRPQDVAEPASSAAFCLCVICRYLKLRALVSLTFGCDGARAAAPIANARTAFIVASKLAPIANLPQTAPKLGLSLRQVGASATQSAKMKAVLALAMGAAALAPSQPKVRDLTAFRSRYLQMTQKQKAADEAARRRPEAALCAETSL